VSEDDSRCLPHRPASRTGISSGLLGRLLFYPMGTRDSLSQIGALWATISGLVVLHSTRPNAEASAKPTQSFL
jgi:hypothetical protein